MLDLWSRAQPAHGLAIDHIGIVVSELGPTLAWLRDRGFKVNDGVPLKGADGPLGQISAHCVFANGYVEISTPIPGSGNHLEPLLKDGDGVRILALASTDAATDHSRLGPLAAAPPSASSRTVRLGNRELEARFTWFPLIEVVPGTITAVVQHRNPDIVFAAELRDHPNGASRLADVLFGGTAPQLGMAEGSYAKALTDTAAAPGIVGFSIAGCAPFCDHREGYTVRGLL